MSKAVTVLYARQVRGWILELTSGGKAARSCILCAGGHSAACPGSGCVSYCTQEDERESYFNCLAATKAREVPPALMTAKASC